MWLHSQQSACARPSSISSDVGNEASHFGGGAYSDSGPHIPQHVSYSPKQCPAASEDPWSQGGRLHPYVTASRDSPEDSAFDPRNRRCYSSLSRKHVCLAFEPAAPSEATDAQHLSSTWQHLPQQCIADILPRQDGGQSEVSSDGQCSSRTSSTLSYDSSLHAPSGSVRIYNSPRLRASHATSFPGSEHGMDRSLCNGRDISINSFLDEAIAAAVAASSVRATENEQPKPVVQVRI